MYQQLYELSQCLPSRKPWERLNEGMPEIYDRGLAICFDEQGQWTGVEVYQGNGDVVYRAGPPNGTDLTPCCKLAAVTAKTVRRLGEAVKKLQTFPELPVAKKDWLTASLNSYEANREAICEAVTSKIHEAGVDGKTHRGYVYWARSVSRPVYAWPEAKAFMVQQFLESFASGGERRGACAISGQTGETVYGNFSVLACYNLDKPGSIAGGFDKTLAHRNFPVAGDCALALAEAVVFAETQLSSSMAGQSYMILPYANSPEVRDELSHSLRRHPDRYRLAQGHDLVAEEFDLLEEFRGRGDQLAFSLVFFEAKNAAWRIQAEVQELLPSRLHALHEGSRQIQQARDLIVEAKDGDKSVYIGAGTFKQFTGTTKASADTLRAWLAALFERRAIDYRHFLHHLVDKLVGTGKSDSNLLPWMTRQAWGLYRYARLTQLISPPHAALEAGIMQDIIPHSAYGRYIREHSDFFRRPETITAFLTGCYAAQVAAVQRKERGAEPFTKKFIGRLLSRQQLRRLYREGHDKLAQYGKLGYVIRGLDPDLAGAWVACGDGWGISDEEATFAFTIGYSLAYRIGRLFPEESSLPLEQDA